MADWPELNAIATRIDPVELVVSNEEVAALMREVAQQGYARDNWQLSPAECLEVVNFIIDKKFTGTL